MSAAGAERKTTLLEAEDFLDILKAISYKNWRFRIAYEGERPWLQASFEVPNNESPNEVETAVGRKWFLSPHMTYSEVVGTILKAVLTAEEHEARESFKYRGRAIYGPHIDIEALWQACETREYRE